MIDLEASTKSQLRDYAAEELGVDLPENMNKDQMVLKIKEMTEEVKPSKIPKTVKIKIPRMEGDTGKQPVFVNFQGREFLIQRNKEVEVPYGVYEILKNAVEFRYETVRDPETGRRDLEKTEVQSYPAQVVL